MRAVILLALILAPPLRAEEPPLPPGASACKVMQTTGDRFCKFGPRWRLQNARPPAFRVGDAFPVLSQSMLMDLDRYDLPRVDGRWRYYLREGMLYKVSSETGKVIEVIGRARSD